MGGSHDGKKGDAGCMLRSQRAESRLTAVPQGSRSNTEIADAHADCRSHQAKPPEGRESDLTAPRHGSRRSLESAQPREPRRLPYPVPVMGAKRSCARAARHYLALALHATKPGTRKKDVREPYDKSRFGMEPLVETYLHRTCCSSLIASQKSNRIKLHHNVDM